MELPWTVIARIELGPSSLADSAAYLIVLEDARGVRFGVPAVIEDGRLRRARPGDGVAEALLAALAVGVVPAGLDVDLLAPVTAPSGERGFDVDQTNEIVVVGERAVVKWFLHPTDDAQPAPGRMATLAREGFDGTPRPWALVRLAAPGSGALVATIAEYVPDARDGWEWAIDVVRAMARGQADGRAFTADVARLVARMHVGLAGAGTRRATLDEARDWHRGAMDDLQHASLGSDQSGRAADVLDPIGQCAGTIVMDTHGDLHVGQVLRSDDTGRYFVIDFDGSPMQPAAERMRQQPAARDVASMLASLDHVGRVVLHRTDDLDADQREDVLAWIEEAQEAFLGAYRQTLREAGFAGLLDERLIRPFQLQQECREYAYAARYLPHWRYVPDAALPALLSRGSL